MVEDLDATWSSYSETWEERPDLNLGAQVLGDEWGGPDFTDYLFETLVAPQLGPKVDVIELGCGGGKWSMRLAPRCRSLVCTDVSAAMLKRTRALLAGQGLDGNVKYVRLATGVDFAGLGDASADFVFSYDVQLHLQPQHNFSYLLDAHRVLRPGGIFMLHQIDLGSEGGAHHFLSQFGAGTWETAKRGHIYYMSEDQLVALAGMARFSVQRLVTGFPPRDSDFWPVGRERDTVAFLRRETGRYEGRDPGELRALRSGAASAPVWIVGNGRRARAVSVQQVERLGILPEAVEEVSQDQLEALPEDEPLAAWD